MVYGKIIKELPPLRRPKLSKKAQEKDDKNYMKLIGIGMIRYSNYIGISLSGSIQEVKLKEENLIQFLQRFFLLIRS